MHLGEHIRRTSRYCFEEMQKTTTIAISICVVILSIAIVYRSELSVIIWTISTCISKTTPFLKAQDNVHNLGLVLSLEPDRFSSSSPSAPSPGIDKAQTAPPKMILRTITKAFKAIEKAEGAGAVVRRGIGVPQLRNFSPFLMLDHFTIGKGAGFPDHPHRGQETITYLLSGSVDHEDFTGGKGTIHSGDLQFMTAGRGVVHAEMPGKESEKRGIPNTGLQLWVDLPRELKYCEPRYRDLRKEEIPTINPSDKVEIKIISGESHGVESVKDLAYTPVWFLDVTISPGGKVEQNLPKDWNGFLYTLSGSVNVHLPENGENGGAGEENKKKSIPEYYIVALGREGDGVELSVDEESKERARVLIVAGKVLDQEVVQYGPFVVNSQEEVYKAMMDYQSSSNGFERAKGWRSEIGRRIAD